MKDFLSLVYMYLSNPEKEQKDHINQEHNFQAHKEVVCFLFPYKLRSKIWDENTEESNHQKKEHKTKILKHYIQQKPHRNYLRNDTILQRSAKAISKIKYLFSLSVCVFCLNVDVY